MGQCDWAVFSYFTTYSGHYYIFITRLGSLFERFSASLPTGTIVEAYQLPMTQSESFRNATYSDYDVEGELVYKLSAENGEIPYVLCFIESDRGLYMGGNDESEETDGEIW